MLFLETSQSTKFVLDIIFRPLYDNALAIIEYMTNFIPVRMSSEQNGGAGFISLE